MDANDVFLGCSETDRIIEEQSTPLVSVRAENDEHRKAQAAIYLALGTGDPDRETWPASIAALRAQLAAAEERAETLKQQAMQHAHEARTQTSTVHEIYQLITGGTGEPGNWEGAEPVRVALAAARRRRRKG
jgi:hypothetical protein